MTATHITTWVSLVNGKEVSNSAWTEEGEARLRKMWADGIATSEIGRIMGTTKSAIIGKAHRLKLPSRPWVVKPRTGEPRAITEPNHWAKPGWPFMLTKHGRERETLRADDSGLPKVLPKPTFVKKGEKHSTPIIVFKPKPAAVPPSRPRQEFRPVVYIPPGRQIPVTWENREPSDGKCCQFPLNEGNLAAGVQWLFCEKPCDPGVSYCEKHAKICYINYRKKRWEDAA